GPFGPRARPASGRGDRLSPALCGRILTVRSWRLSSCPKYPPASGTRNRRRIRRLPTRLFPAGWSSGLLSARKAAAAPRSGAGVLGSALHGYLGQKEAHAVSQAPVPGLSCPAGASLLGLVAAAAGAGDDRDAGKARSAD